jgi:tetratricopeptide (TPR) repeat protein
MRALFTAIVILSLTPRVLAHGDMHERINALTTAIAGEPDSGSLYLQRAELHRAHEDYPAALQDYARAEALAHGQSAIDYGRGLALAALRRDAEAVASLTRCVEREPRRYDAFAARARLHARSARIEEAVADYDRAIALAPVPEPDFLLERARILARATPPQLDRAATGLREALANRGNVAALALELCDIEIRREKFDEALAIIDRLRSSARRQENWLMRRGEILTKAGRADEATRTFREALAALEALAPHLRGAPATRELEETLRTRIADTRR